MSPSKTTPCRVVVVEDSLVQRAHLVELLQADGDISVVGEAATATEAIDVVARLLPDVVTLDLHIPEGGGLHALEQIMAFTPTPVVVLSSAVENDRSAPAIAALVAGALIAMPKPARWTAAAERELRASVHMARNVPVIRHVRGRLRSRPTETEPTTRSASLEPSATTKQPARPPIVAIAASTGGPPALATVLSNLAGLRSPVLIVQHLHPDFVAGLVDWMKRVSPLPVVLAENGQVARNGHVHVAPGGLHLRLGAGSRLELAERPLSIHRPSADQLFGSIAETAGARAIGVILTGMGEDGAVGLAAMHAAGAHTIGQDAATSAVYGMPRAAFRLGAVDRVLALPDIALAILTAAQRIAVSG